MFPSFLQKNARVILVVSCVLIVLNSLLIGNPVLGAFLLVCYLSTTSLLVGRGAVGFILVLSLLAILGSAIFYLVPATQGAYLILVLVVGIGACLVDRRSKIIDTETKVKPSQGAIAICILLVLSLAAWWFAILPTAITEPVRSPWELIDPFAVAAIGVSVFLLASLLARPNTRHLGIVFTFVTLFSALTLALVAYPLGFGFDPFIHRATVAHILEHGTITPKPFYYIGQYALELIAVHVFSLPLFFVDRLLVPLLAALIATLTASVGMKNRFSLTALFLLPLSAFVVTTPQALAYLFTIALLFLSLPRLRGEENAPALPALFVITLAALVTHPLAGIPALIYFVLVAVATTPMDRAMKTVGLAFLSLMAAISLPAIFVFQAKFSGLQIAFTLSHLFDTSLLTFTSFFRNQYSSTFDLLYLIIDNHLWILVVLALVGAYFVRDRKALLLPLLAAVIWMVNYWLLSTTLEFNFLIEYERQNYAVRLLTLTAIFLIPLVGEGLSHIKKAAEKSTLMTGTIFAAIAVLAAANVYGAYPRHDNYARSAGFNVGESDFAAVYAVNTDAGDSAYIVLANQAVSAAALEAFGFKTYYHGDIFYYPIPTGGELYQYYLEMADDAPTRERATAAMDLAGVDTAYFIVNDYWWQSEAIVERAKQESNEWFSVENGATTVFIYRRDESTVSSSDTN